MGDEDRKQRVNRELSELLNELRVALPGVQVLFAFLLSVPFQQRFSAVTTFQRDVYYATLLMAALSIVLLIAPAAQHRVLFRMADKEPMLFRSNKYATTGLLCLGAALTAAILLVTSYLFDSALAVITASVATVLILVFWVVVPLLRRRSGVEDV
jgi:hypothetical protein